MDRPTLQPIQGEQTSLAVGTTRHTLQEQVEAILGNKGLLFVTTAKGNATCPNSALNLRGNEMIHGLKIKCCWYKLKQVDQINYDEERTAYLQILILEDKHTDSHTHNDAYKHDYAMPSFEQSNVVNHSETEITGDSNIIPYSQYVIESQQAAVQNSNSSAQQDALILYKAQQLEPKLYDGNVIKNTSAIVIPDSEETLMLAEESRSKMLLKQKDPMMLEKKVNTTPVDYVNSVNSPEPTLSSRPTKVEVPKELPKVSMVNTSLKKLKYHLAGFDVVVKERTTPTAITEGSWGFEHTKACFRDEIIPFVKALKDLFNTFDQYLIDELSEVQNVFHQMEQAVEQHRLESKTFEVKMNQVLNENERLLEQVINKDIVNIL
ncbi:hypothetical protein Tco_0561777 [Tanacetum coccineum]